MLTIPQDQPAVGVDTSVAMVRGCDRVWLHVVLLGGVVHNTVTGEAVEHTSMLAVTEHAAPFLKLQEDSAVALHSSVTMVRGSILVVVGYVEELLKTWI